MPWYILATAPPKRVPVKTNELDNQQKTKANSHVSNLKEIPYSDGNLLVNVRVNLSFLNSFRANSGGKISPEETSTYFRHRTHPNRPKQYHNHCFSTIRPMGIRNSKLVFTSSASLSCAITRFLKCVSISLIHTRGTPKALHHCNKYLAATSAVQAAVLYQPSENLDKYP